MNSGNARAVPAANGGASPDITDDAAPVPAAGRDRPLIALTLLVAAFATIYALVGVLNHHHFGSSLDLGIFDQAVWHLSRFERPFSSVKGYNIFGDHFHPIILLFVPLYWVAPGPDSLIVTQALGFAASIVPVFLFLRRRFAFGHTVALCTAYGLFWGLQRAALFDVHEFAFAPLFVGAAILAVDRRHWTWLWVWCVLLVLTKEDLIPLVTFLGLYVFVITGDRRQGAALVGFSLACFFVILRIVIPWFSGLGYYAYSNAYGEVLARPWRLFIVLVTPVEKARTILLWLSPFLFLPLLSPYSLLLIPFVLERFLSVLPGHWGTSFHYSAPLAPILVMGAGDGLARLLRVGRILPGPPKRMREGGDPASGRRAQAATLVVAAIVLLSMFLPGRQPMWRLFSPAHWGATPGQRTAPAALAMIPPDASVAAPAAIASHLSQRARIHILDASAPDADFIVASSLVDPWPLTSESELQALLKDRRDRGYRVVYDAEGWTVLRRP
jgi:uncharacterized membrane protein